MKSVKFPKSIVAIEKGAFKGCKKLDNIEIPNTVIRLGERAFSGCSSLKNITLSNNLYELSSYLFENCTSLETIKIPNSVTRIESCAFYGCKSLEKVNIEDNIKFIDFGIFINCISLKNIDIPEKVNEIGNFAFGDCISLKSIEIPKCVKKIGKYAFLNCKSLSEIKLPNDLERILSGAFDKCKSLKNIEIPEKVNEIGKDAFLNIEKVVYNGIACGSPWGAKEVSSDLVIGSKFYSMQETVNLLLAKLDRVKYLGDLLNYIFEYEEDEELIVRNIKYFLTDETRSIESTLLKWDESLEYLLLSDLSDDRTFRAFEGIYSKFFEVKNDFKLYLKILRKLWYNYDSDDGDKYIDCFEDEGIDSENLNIELKNEGDKEYYRKEFEGDDRYFISSRKSEREDLEQFLCCKTFGESQNQ